MDVTAAGRGDPASAWQLVEAAQAGDMEAFGQLYRAYREGVRRFIYKKTRDRDLADEITSATFVKALVSIGSLRRSGSSPEAWFTTIARNLVFDHYKSARVRLAALNDEASEAHLAGLVDAAPGPEAAAFATADRDALIAAMRQLTPEHREVLDLRFLQDLSQEETARWMGRDVASTKALQFRATRALARLLPREAIAA